MPIKRAVIYVVGETVTTGCTFFHWLTRYEDGMSLSSSANGNRVTPMAKPSMITTKNQASQSCVARDFCPRCCQVEIQRLRICEQKLQKILTTLSDTSKADAG